MKILLVADGRSPTTRSWVKLMTAIGHQVILISTFPCPPVDGVEADVVMPVAFSSLGRSGSDRAAGARGKQSAVLGLASRARPFLMTARYLLGPLTLRYYAPRLRWIIERLQPDIIHALRIPYEGMLAAAAPPEIPLAVSIWGNDLTLHVSGSKRMADLTRRTLARANALLVDARRDARLARAWGLGPDTPVLVVPGSGGIHIDEMLAVRQQVEPGMLAPDHIVPGGGPLVINPRGFRTGSVRQDTFFQAVPLVLQRRPEVVFACPAMADQPEAIQWLNRFQLQGKVHLLPVLDQPRLWELFARAEVSISVSQHDGTPNSLLEAMALGAFPVAGDIESLREWIIPGVNGLLIEPDKPQALAEAILLALDRPDLRAAAALKNRLLVSERAEAEVVREKVSLLYESLAASREIPV